MANPPRLVLLDTAHLTAWFADRTSEHEADRQRAAAFEQRLERLNWAPLLTWHHFEELLQHENRGVVTRRLQALQALPRLAWVRCLASDGLGGVTDIMAAEALSACLVPRAGLGEIKAFARRDLLCLGSGRTLFGPRPLDWLLFRPLVQNREPRTREIVAINRSDFAGVSEMKIKDLLAGQRSSPEEAAQRLTALGERLAADIASHGDHRIIDAKAPATQLMAEAKALADQTPGSVRDLVVGILTQFGIRPHEIDPEARVGDMTDLVVFRLQLRTVSEKLTVPWSVLVERATPARSPSYRLGHALDRHAQLLPEHKGSELNDNYLLRAGSYADLALVDKRTLENVRRARRQEHFLAEVLGEVARAAHYHEVLADLDA